MSNKEPCLQEYKQKCRAYFPKSDVILLAIITLLIAIIILLVLEDISEFGSRLDRAGTAVSAIGYLPVLALLYFNRKKQWENSLPKYLDVHFEFEEKVRLKMSGIPLIGEADMRAQAQTASTILTQGAYFPLQPIIKEGSSTKVCHDKNGSLNSGNPFRLTTVRIDLSEDLHPNMTDKNNRPLFSGAIKKYVESLTADSYIYAYYPFNLDKNITVREQPNKL